MKVQDATKMFNKFEKRIRERQMKLHKTTTHAYVTLATTAQVLIDKTFAELADFPLLQKAPYQMYISEEDTYHPWQTYTPAHALEYYLLLTPRTANLLIFRYFERFTALQLKISKMGSLANQLIIQGSNTHFTGAGTLDGDLFATIRIHIDDEDDGIFVVDEYNIFCEGEFEYEPDDEITPEDIASLIIPNGLLDYQEEHIATMPMKFYKYFEEYKEIYRKKNAYQKIIPNVKTLTLSTLKREIHTAFNMFFNHLFKMYNIPFVLKPEDNNSIKEK